MKRFFVATLAVISMIALPVIAGAVPMTHTDTTIFTKTGTILAEDYIDHGTGDVNLLDGTGDYVAWEHLFTLVPPASEILSAELTVCLGDDEQDEDFNVFTWEVGIGFAEDGTWDFGEVDTGAYAYDVNVDYLSDGSFQVVLGSIWGDYYVHKSQLEITYEPVPEPATVMLLGSGILGFAASRRRLKA